MVGGGPKPKTPMLHKLDIKEDLVHATLEGLEDIRDRGKIETKARGHWVVIVVVDTLIITCHHFRHHSSPVRREAVDGETRTTSH